MRDCRDGAESQSQSQSLVPDEGEMGCVSERPKKLFIIPCRVPFFAKRPHPVAQPSLMFGAVMDDILGFFVGLGA